MSPISLHEIEIDLFVKKIHPISCVFFVFYSPKISYQIIHFWLCIGSSQDTYSISIRDRTNPLLITKLIFFVFTATDNIPTGNFTNQSELLIHATTTLLGNIIGKLFIFQYSYIYWILISIHKKYTSIFSRLHYAFKHTIYKQSVPFFQFPFHIIPRPKITTLYTISYTFFLILNTLPK